MPRNYNRKCAYLVILCTIFIVVKMIVLYENTLTLKSFGETKTETEDSIFKSENAVSQISNYKRHHQQHSKHKEYATDKTIESFILPSKWENAFEIMKLKQMILNNARNQILIKRQFNI